MPSCVTGRTILRGPSRCPPTNAVSVHFRQPLHVHEAIDQLISDLLPTATAAVLDDAPLVTRNVKDFIRIPGLRVMQY